MDGIAWEPDERDMSTTRGGTLQAVSKGVEPRGSSLGRRSSVVSARSARRVAGLLGTVAGLFVSFISPSASAQAWLADRAASEGAGVRLGDFELHPGIGAQAGYDSNWFLRTDKTGAGITNGGVVGTPELLITPSLSLATLGTLRREGVASGSDDSPITFRASASGTYREYFGQLSPEQRNGSIDASANLGILPGRPWGGALSVTYDRVIQPSSFGDPDLAFTRDVISGSAEVAAQPGSGTLDWHLGATATTALFEDTGGQGYNNIGFGVYTKGRWKFRPKTARLYDFTTSFNSYTNTTAGEGTLTPLHSATPVRTRIGINGLITPRFSLLAMAGYGGSFFTPASDPQVQQYDSLIAQGELKYYLTALADGGNPGAVSLSQSTLALGYTRDFQTSYLTDLYGLDRGYLNFSYFFAGRLLVTLTGGMGAIEYPTLFLPTNTHTGFTDLRADATLYGEYRFTNSFALNATLRYTTNVSGAIIDITPAKGAAQELYAMQWQRIEAYLGVRLFL
jgi:hypothetical protein